MLPCSGSPWLPCLSAFSLSSPLSSEKSMDGATFYSRSCRSILECEKEFLSSVYSGDCGTYLWIYFTMRLRQGFKALPRSLLPVLHWAYFLRLLIWKQTISGSLFSCILWTIILQGCSAGGPFPEMSSNGRLCWSICCSIASSFVHFLHPKCFGSQRQKRNDCIKWTWEIAQNSCVSPMFPFIPFHYFLLCAAYPFLIEKQHLPFSQFHLNE